METITGAESAYQSPTDMGVNRAGSAILDDEAVQAAARQEVIRRYFRYACEYAMGLAEKETVQRAELLMGELGMRPEDRRVVAPARRAAAQCEQTGKGHNGVFCGAALELRDETVVTGKNSELMHSASSLVLNAAKGLAGLPDELHLLSPNVIESIACLKGEIMNAKSASLDLEETLIALGISSTTSPSAALAMMKLKELRGCEVHLTHIPTPGDEAGLRRLGVNLTSEPNFASKDLFVS